MSTDPAEPSSAAGESGALQQDQPSGTQQTDSQPATAPALPKTEVDTDTTMSMSVPNEAELDAEINPTSQQQSQPPPPAPSADPMNMDGTASDLPVPTQPPATAEPNLTTHPAVVPEPRIPQKKDSTLRDFLSKTDDYAPLIPDAVTDYYLTLAGLPPPPETDRRLARILALATQKFVADVAADAYQYSRIRSTNTTSNNPLTGLGGAAGFGMLQQQNQSQNQQGGQDGGAGGEGGGGGAKGGKKDAKSAPLGGPRAGFGGGGAAGGGGQGRTVLTMEDLGMAVGEYGVNVKRGEFYR